MLFTERLVPPAGWFAVACLLAGSFGLILVPLSTTLAWIVGIAMAVLAGVIVYLTSPITTVKDGWLTAGPARIEGRFISGVEVLDREQTRRRMGPDADARAFASHRDHARGSVCLTIDDPRDPTPYWLVSSDRAEDLAAAVEQIRS